MKTIAAIASDLMTELSTVRAENAALRARVEKLREALQSVRNELGVPQPGYIAPVANASDIALAALAADDAEKK